MNYDFINGSGRSQIQTILGEINELVTPLINDERILEKANSYIDSLERNETECETTSNTISTTNANVEIDRTTLESDIDNVNT